MAPELFQGRSFTRKVDVYAYGILLWEIVSGNLPFSGYVGADIRDKVLRGDRPLTTGIACSMRMKSLIEICWWLFIIECW